MATSDKTTMSQSQARKSKHESNGDGPTNAEATTFTRSPLRAPQPRLLHLQRRCWVILIVIFLVLIGLILGLYFGLTRRKAKPSIPFPELGGTHAASLTFYEQRPNLCNRPYLPPDQLVGTGSLVAVSGALWDAVLARNETLCGWLIAVKQTLKDGFRKESSYRVVDRCDECGMKDLAMPKDQMDRVEMAGGEWKKANVEWEWWKRLD